MSFSICVNFKDYFTVSLSGCPSGMVEIQTRKQALCQMTQRFKSSISNPWMTPFSKFPYLIIVPDSQMCST